MIESNRAEPVWASGHMPGDRTLRANPPGTLTVNLFHEREARSASTTEGIMDLSKRAKSLFLLGNAHLGRSDFAGAIKSYSEALQLNPQ
jgi:hypothetical protein